MRWFGYFILILLRRKIMAKNKAKAELVKKEEVHPVSMFEEMESNFDRFLRHPFSMMMRPTRSAFDFPKMDDISPSVDILKKKVIWLSRPKCRV